MRTPMVCNCMVTKLHQRVSERAVLCDTAFDAHTPPFERARCKRSAHRLYYLGLTDSQALLDGFKRSSVFPSHLNQSGHVAIAKWFGFFRFHKSNSAVNYRYQAHR